MGPKVTFVIGTLMTGGAERHAVEIATALSARGYRMRIFCLFSGGELESDLEGTGVRIIKPLIAPETFSKFGRLGGLVQLAHLGMWSMALWLHLLFTRPHIIHCFLPLSNVIGIFAARAAFIRNKIASRRSLNLYRASMPRVAKLEQLAFAMSSWIAPNSKSAARELVEEEGQPDAKIIVIQNGIDMSRIASRNGDDMRKKLGLPDDCLVMTIVANLIPYKGHADLITALGKVKTQLPPSWQLLVAGRDQGIAVGLLELASDLGIADNITLLGLERNVGGLMKISDIGIMASHEEGFPNTAVEYMAAGLPVIGTSVGDLPEIVVDGITGLIVPAKAPTEMGKAIVSLASSVEKRKSMGEAGHIRAAETYSLAACADKYEALYSSMD